MVANSRDETPQMPETEAYKAKQRELARLTQEPDNRLVSQEERIAIWDAYLELGSYLAVSKKLGRDRETIARHIKCQEFDAYEAKAREEASKAVMSVMSSRALDYGDHWFTASQEAAAKGDHRPAKDALTALGVVKPDQPTAQQGIVIVNGMDQAGQALPNPFQAFAGRSETRDNPSRQILDTEDGAVPQAQDGCWVEGIKAEG